MKKEMIKVLRSMGYRRIEGSKDYYAKPIGYSVITFDADKKLFCHRFVNIKNEVDVWSSKDLSQGWDSLFPEDFEDAIKCFEAWETNIKICAEGMKKDMKKFNFLTNEENYEIEMGINQGEK